MRLPFSLSRFCLLRFVVGVLAVANGRLIELEPIAGLLPRQPERPVKPPNFRFDAELDSRRHGGRAVETADGHRNSVVLIHPISERRAAFGAKAALGDG